METNFDLAIGDVHVGGHIDEVAQDLASLALGVAAHALTEAAMETAGDDEQRDVEVDPQGDGGSEVSRSAT